MRDIVLFGILLLCLPISFSRPPYGAIIYAVFSYLNPQRLTWGFAYNMQMAKAIAVSTLLGMLLYKGEKKLPREPEIFLILILWLLASLGWIFAFNPDGFFEEWDRFSKILLMILATVCLIKTKENFRFLLWAIAISIGFYTLKGAVWGLRGGAGHVWGPAGTFFYGNNEMGLVINMVWPIFFVMARNEKNVWLKRLLWLFFFVSPLTVILTKSRGAALALFITGIFLFIRAKQKTGLIFVGCVIAFITIPMIPSEWYERMETIENYQADASAMGRINAWYAAWNMAVDNPLTGGGLRAFTPWVIERYAPNPDDYHDVHSIYFEILGEVGFPGLLVFLSIIGVSLLSLKRIVNLPKTYPSLSFYANYADGIFIGIIAYCANGAFLGLAYFDLFYQFVGLTVSLKVIVQKEIEVLISTEEENTGTSVSI